MDNIETGHPSKLDKISGPEHIYILFLRSEITETHKPHHVQEKVKSGAPKTRHF